MEHLNWKYLQLRLVALIFWGLQIWWIGSNIMKRELARPLSEGEFRRRTPKAGNPGRNTRRHNFTKKYYILGDSGMLKM